MYINRITTMVSANTCIKSHYYHFFSVVRSIKVYSLRYSEVYNTVSLTVITML